LLQSFVGWLVKNIKKQIYQTILMRSTLNAHPVIIIGAGPAGLTAGYELLKHNLKSVVLEQASQVGASLVQKPTKTITSILVVIVFLLK